MTRTVSATREEQKETGSDTQPGYHGGIMPSDGMLTVSAQGGWHSASVAADKDEMPQCCGP
eukprot:765496-Hanusia_phi.AAC.2